MKNRIAIYSTDSGSFHLKDMETGTLPSPHHVMLKVKWVGICGSDLHSIETKFLKELSLGHEWIGEVIEKGSDVQSVHVGDHVTSTVMIGCGTCDPCVSGTEDCEKKISLAVSHGMLREIAWLPEQFLVKVPAPVSQNSTLFEILAVGENVFSKTQSDLRPAQQLLILGAGLLGLSVGLVFKKRGYQPLILETIPARIRRAQSLGLECRHLGEALLDIKLKDTQEFIVDATGDHLGSKGGWMYLDHFGKKNFKAIILAKYLETMNLKTDRFFSKQARLEWIQGCTRKSLEDAIENWKGEIASLGDKLITHTFALEEVNEAFAQAKKREQSGRVIVGLNP